MSSAAASVLLPGQPIAGPSNAGAGSSARQPPRAGNGTYRRGDYILSSLIGHREEGDEGTSSSSWKGKGPQRVEPRTVSVKGARARFPVPRTDSVVLARVIRVSPRQANCTLLVVDGIPCGVNATSSASAQTHLLLGGSVATDDGNPDNLFQGVIRAQDVRATNKDSVRMSECFRPGDIVRASVISLGDARSYYLSTASNELGVVYAVAASSTAPDYVVLPTAADDAASEGAARGKNAEATLLRARPDAVPLQPLNWAEMQDPTTGVIERRKVAKPLVA